MTTWLFDWYATFLCVSRHLTNLIWCLSLCHTLVLIYADSRYVQCNMQLVMTLFLRLTKRQEHT